MAHSPTFADLASDFDCLVDTPGSEDDIQAKMAHAGRILHHNCCARLLESLEEYPDWLPNTPHAQITRYRHDHAHRVDEICWDTYWWRSTVWLWSKRFIPEARIGRHLSNLPPSLSAQWMPFLDLFHYHLRPDTTDDDDSLWNIIAETSHQACLFWDKTMAWLPDRTGNRPSRTSRRLIVDADHRRIRFDEKQYDFPSRLHFDLFKYLYDNPDKWVTVDALCEHVWHGRRSHSTVKSTVSRLRASLESAHLPQIAALIKEQGGSFRFSASQLSQ